MRNKNIIIAEYAGFCPGVKNAFLKALAIADKYKNPYLFGDIVHNRFVLEKLLEKGIIIENDLEKLLQNQDAQNIIIRTHGISPAVKEKLIKSNKRLFDLTCPRVKKVHSLVIQYCEKKHPIFIYGKPLHPEVLGILGFCNNNCYVIDNIENLQINLPDNIVHPVLISQTTMNSEKFFQLSVKLKEIYPDLITENTLCHFPLKIQENGIALAKKSEIMLVIGDKKSSNTRTLLEKVQLITKAFFVETIDDLPDLQSYNHIGITGGASTPDFQINNIFQYIKEKYHSN
ncbi:MAG: 4-hydroxy-3-methylbut-2-enyl diphosphate reductase [Spirochaetes bacterium]|nr:4-hydroxy-3-methylbut-2-enyl diphosphate reductase [Spirochaetota bacterium]